MNQTYSIMYYSCNLCNGRNDCLLNGDDEQFCITNRTLIQLYYVYVMQYNLPFAY